MAPSHSRQLLVWSLPTIAVLLSYLWYKKRRIGAQSDPGDIVKRPPSRIEDKPKSLEEELKEVQDNASLQETSPTRTFSRSLSGVDSAPIDIVLPPELRSVKSTSLVISDEDLDFEIEKVKSMKNGIHTLNTNSPIMAHRPKDSPQVPSGKKQNKSNNKTKKEQPTLLEAKFEELKLDTAQAAAPSSNPPNARPERDSANNSPGDGMLASPSLSSISDNGEGSNDSGKGGSDVATPPPSRDVTTPPLPIYEEPIRILYDFTIPQSLVGKLIGRRGAFIAQIKEKTRANVLVKKHPNNNKYKLCSVEGTEEEVDKALKMIRDKFPVKRFAEITLEQVNLLQEIDMPLNAELLYCKLVEGVNNDTIISCLVTPSYLFLQQPTHPTFPGLNDLRNYMNVIYNGEHSPLLPYPIKENSLCAAYSVGSWCRAMILSYDTESEKAYVKFLDYGGFAYLDYSDLRQIRGDLILLPFQAAECILAHVQSLSEDGSWPQEAFDLVANYTKGAIICTQIADFTEDNVPIVQCYVVVGHNRVVYLNQELVNHGFAEWVPLPYQQSIQAEDNIE